ncbi:hypothetical protein BP6252_06428 [Coleophoma cylindrospora]|uniref:Uncharacterized protein n=1 Tax=Coleophoma cylindrospora TaxID=1849047 RepID=A0A3D8RMX6_9HELO|nr:hypothetical protein BP6252_06428 [Coleophoma cylindrospora]
MSPVMESITIINKSGKVVSTGKHLVNIFKDARDAYQEKKAELRFENQRRLDYKTQQKLLQAREETRSVASSRHSHRSHRSHRSSATREGGDRSRPPLTVHNLSHIDETESVASSRRSSRRGSRSHHGGPRSSSHQGERVRSPERPQDMPSSYRAPYMETALESRPDLIRRQTDHVNEHQTVARRPLPRSASNPNMGENIDMNLAYGDLPHPSSLDLALAQVPEAERQAELQETMSKLDSLLLEAQCLQHSATTIISNLQANPEAMAAVALTLAELSNLLAKMSPGILAAIKTSSPAIFALLASPQFLIAGGVAIGVTIVMFGGFKIIKKIQGAAEAKSKASCMDEAMVFEGDYNTEMTSIESWRRGIAEVEAQSVATSVDGEFITPEADRQRRERIRDRAREERRQRRTEVESVRSESVRSETVRSEGTVRRREAPARSSSKSVVTAAASDKTIKEKKKKSNALTILFKKKDKDTVKEKKKAKSSTSHHPRMIEI